MSNGSPWRDALRRASLGGQAAHSPAAAAPVADTGTGASTLAAAQASPRLAELLREREALEGRMQSLLGAPAADPRYAVEPLAARRAEFARWSSARDQRREQAVPAATPPRPEPSARLPRPGDPPPALRATPGEAVPAGTVPVDPSAWMRQRDRRVPRERAANDDAAAALPDPGRALRALGLAPRADGSSASGNGPGDPLARLQERARRRVAESRLARSEAAQALAKARQAIPEGWEERLRERIPGLGRADPYVRETARKLSVAVGTLQEIGDKSERLRESAQAVRELQRADEAGDDARRDRALERLKARRAEDDRDV